MELLKLIGKFELLKENYLTETTHHGNQELLNEFFPDKLATAMHGRKKPARLDFVLAEIVWLATDFDQEKCYKTDQAKFISELIAGYVRIVTLILLSWYSCILLGRVM